MEYWQGEKKDERYAVQMIQLLLKEYLDFLGKGDTAVEEVLRKFEMTLPFLQRLVISDMKAAYEGDPAAESYMEIIAAYPGPLAVLIQRTANCLYKLKVPILPRIMTEYAHSMTGIDIHPGAKIGESFFIDHGTGVVIGETTVIGDYVKIYQGVTLGALSTRGGHKQKSTPILHIQMGMAVIYQHKCSGTRYTNLYIVCRQKLIIAHVIRFDAHKGS